MPLLLACSLVVVLCSSSPLESDESPPRFIRGDANLDGRVTLADSFTVLRHVTEGTTIPCLDAADVDDNGRVNRTDVFRLLTSLFYRHITPPAPFPKAGEDTTLDSLGCRQGIGARFVGDFNLPDDSPADATQDGAGCEDDGGAADLEFIHFRGSVLASPGETGIKVPVYLTSAGGVEGLTLSFYAPPGVLRLDEIDYSVNLLGGTYVEPVWAHTYSELRDEGYLAATMAMSLSPEVRTLPRVRSGVIARLVFSVLPDAEIGERVSIRFRNLPAGDGLPPIRNEISRGGFSQPQYVCGLSVEIVQGDDVFLRGDSNRDRTLNVIDVVTILRFLFVEESEGTVVPCLDAADIDDNGHVELTDAIDLATYLFGRGSQPAPPFPNAGRDTGPPDDLGCAEK